MTADPVANILATYGRASADQLARGRRWYPLASTLVDAIAEWSTVDRDRVAAAMAALSPRNPWNWNVADTAAFSAAAGAGETVRPRATTFSQNADRAWAIVTGRGPLTESDDWTTTALKVRSFVANILGDTNAVTVDVWAIRVATVGGQSEVRNDGQYRAIADAYRSAAVILGETPRDLQAITWLVAESAGIASARRGRHSATIKRGTPAFLRTLLTGQLAAGL